MPESIMCPNCNFQFEVSTVLSAQLREQLRKEMHIEFLQKETALATHEDALKERERAVEQAQRTLEAEVDLRVEEEGERLRKEAKSKAQEAVAVEVQDLHAQLLEAKNELTLAQQAELQLRKERRDIEDQKNALELTVNRRLDEERSKIREETKRVSNEEYRLREADKDKLVADLKHQIAELKRRSEQASQQAQGEVMEVELEGLLIEHFPFDTFEPVPVGVHGGDLLQHVYDHTSAVCGTILWESKRTKAWSDAWLPKLRDDQRAASAHLAVLATLELPKGLTNFGHVDGVWITNRDCLVGLASALRAGLVEIAKAKRTMEGQQTKIDLLFEYFSGLEFSQRVEGIVEAFSSLRNDLEAEKRSMHRIWAKRQKQLDRAVVNTAGLYGDVGGILGAKLPQIPKLELAAITHDAPAEESEKAPWD